MNDNGGGGKNDGLGETVENPSKGKNTDKEEVKREGGGGG